MYVVIYADTELAKHVEQSLRGKAALNIDDLVKKWFWNRGLRDLGRWLEEHQKHNIAIAIPIPSDEVLNKVARFEAIVEATSRIVNDYLLEYVKERSKLSEELRKIIEIEQSEIHKAIASTFVDSLKALVDAYSQALSHVYIYECKHGGEAGLTCQASLKKVSVSREVREGVTVDQHTYNKLIDSMMRVRDREIKNLAGELVKTIKKYAGFVDDFQQARTLIVSYVVEDLKEKRIVEIRRDMNVYVYGSQVFYIPPDIVEKTMCSITRDELIQALKGRDVNIVCGEVARIELIGAPQPQVSAPVKEPQTAVVVDEFAKAIEVIKATDKGLVSILIEYDKSSKHTIITFLNALKKYAKRIEVKA